MAAYLDAFDRFVADHSTTGWGRLPFFHTESTRRMIEAIDARAASGAVVLPPPDNVFDALAQTPPAAVRVVILGQDPYPTPGHAHGLAFSYLGDGALPGSLRNIFKELASDLGGELRTKGDLSDWAAQGVLLLNPSLTVEAGKAGAHMEIGWQELAWQIVRRLSEDGDPCVFILWGAKARVFRDAIDRSRHMLIESAHPSPLSARNGFFGSKPFSRANDYLTAHSQTPIRW
jgi:uracil-DNA glycosylase